MNGVATEFMSEANNVAVLGNKTTPPTLRHCSISAFRNSAH